MNNSESEKSSEVTNAEMQDQSPRGHTSVSSLAECEMPSTRIFSANDNDGHKFRSTENLRVERSSQNISNPYLCQLERNSSSHVKIDLMSAFKSKLPDEIISDLIFQDVSSLMKPVNSSGFLPIHVAAAYEVSPKIMNQLISLNPESCMALDTAGNTPLHVAAINGCHLDAFKILYEANNFAIYQSNKSGNLPIHLAAMNSASDGVISFLIDKNREGCQQPNSAGWLPLHCSLYYPQISKFKPHLNSDNINGIRVILKAYPDAVMTPALSGGTPIDLCFSCRRGDLLCRIVLGGYLEGLSPHDRRMFRDLTWLSRKWCMMWYYSHIISLSRTKTGTDPHHLSPSGSKQNTLANIIQALADVDCSGSITMNSPLLRQVILFI